MIKLYHQLYVHSNEKLLNGILRLIILTHGFSPQIITTKPNKGVRDLVSVGLRPKTQWLRNGIIRDFTRLMWRGSPYAVHMSSVFFPYKQQRRYRMRRIRVQYFMERILKIGRLDTVSFRKIWPLELSLLSLGLKQTNSFRQCFKIFKLRFVW